MAKETNFKFEAIKSILRVFLNECFCGDEIKKQQGPVENMKGAYPGLIGIPKG